MKRARALKKAKNEQDLCRQKDREIEKSGTSHKTITALLPFFLAKYRLVQEIEELNVTGRKQKSKLKKYTIYRQFLEKVVEQSDEVSSIFEERSVLVYLFILQFDETQEIISRYETLKQTREV